MTDRAIRIQERRAQIGDNYEATRLLAQRLRSGELTQAQVDCRAYQGDEAARNLEGAPKWWEAQDADFLPTRWVGRTTGGLVNKGFGLLPLLLALPDPEGVGWEDKCEQCRTQGFHDSNQSVHGVPIAFHCKGNRPPTPEERQRWYCVLIAQDVAQAARNHLLDTWDGGEPNYITESGRSIDAASAWLANPSAEEARHYADTVPDSASRIGRLLRDTALLMRGGLLSFSSIIINAAQIDGVDVRAVALKAMRPHLGMEEA